MERGPSDESTKRGRATFGGLTLEYLNGVDEAPRARACIHGIGSQVKGRPRARAAAAHMGHCHVRCIARRASGSAAGCAAASRRWRRKRNAPRRLQTPRVPRLRYGAASRPGMFVCTLAQFFFRFAAQTAPLTPLRAADDATEAVDEALVDVSLEDGGDTPRMVRPDLQLWACSSRPPRNARR